MLQEDVQKMRTEQATAARRQKTLMKKKKSKDNINHQNYSGKMASYFQRKKIAVVATAQPSEDPEKEVSKCTLARNCKQQII